MILQDKKTDIFKNRFGGNGDMIAEHYIDERLLGDRVVLYAKVTLKPGCSLGYHAHIGTTETIVVLSGSAEYNDNGIPAVLKAGDVVHCPEGESHAIGNSSASTEDLLLQALILKA